jgi:hypothetical protein
LRDWLRIDVHQNGHKKYFDAVGARSFGGAGTFPNAAAGKQSYSLPDGQLGWRCNRMRACAALHTDRHPDDSDELRPSGGSDYANPKKSILSSPPAKNIPIPFFGKI